MSKTNYDILAGTIVAAHGVQGGLKIRLATKTALPLISAGDGVSRKPVDVMLVAKAVPAEPGAQIAEPEGRIATITSLKQIDTAGAIVLVKLQNVKDRNQAESLIGTSVYAPQSRRAPLADDEFFVEDLIGLPVIGEGGSEYGKIKAVLDQPANDVYETDMGVLVPAVKAFIKQVDIAGGKVVVFDIPGLRPEEAEVLLPVGGADDDS